MMPPSARETPTRWAVREERHVEKHECSRRETGRGMRSEREEAGEEEEDGSEQSMPESLMDSFAMFLIMHSFVVNMNVASSYADMEVSSGTIGVLVVDEEGGEDDEVDWEDNEGDE